MPLQIPQVVQNFQQGHTGVLSVLTLIMNIGGNVARLGTSLREGLAPVVVYSFVLNGSLNLILFAQVLLYWRATDAAIKGGKVGKAATSTPSKGNKTPSATPQSGKSTGKKGKPKAE